MASLVNKLSKHHFVYQTSIARKIMVRMFSFWSTEHSLMTIPKQVTKLGISNAPMSVRASDGHQMSVKGLMCFTTLYNQEKETIRAYRMVSAGLLGDVPSLTST